MDWISLIVTIIVFGLIVGLFLWAIQALPLIPDVIRQILRVVIIVVATLSVIGMLTGHGPIFHLRTPF